MSTQTILYIAIAMGVLMAIGCLLAARGMLQLNLIMIFPGIVMCMAWTAICFAILDMAVYPSPHRSTGASLHPHNTAGFVAIAILIVVGIVILFPVRGMCRRGGSRQP